jgi:hypothetical protein
MSGSAAEWADAATARVCGEELLFQVYIAVRSGKGQLGGWWYVPTLTCQLNFGHSAVTV